MRPLNPVVMIPSRLGSERLPDKPLADLFGEPMIVHVWRCAMAAKVGPVFVACADTEIARAIENVGGEAILIPQEVASGSERIALAIESIDPEQKHDVVVNLQGDQPFLAPDSVQKSLEPLEDPSVDIGSLAAELSRKEHLYLPNFVKVAASFPKEGPPVARALYFSRAAIPWSSDSGVPYYEHIGIYAYRRKALQDFFRLPQTLLEKRESLEQLRALEAGMHIGVRLVEEAPVSVDTPDDLDWVRKNPPKNPARTLTQ